MHYLRIYAGTDGESHFEEVKLPAAATLTNATITTPVTPTEGPCFVESTNADTGWHAAPRKQMALLLSGRVVVAVSDGERRTLEPGAACFFEDTTGKGHANSYPDPDPRRWVLLPAPG